ncbi:unnamed protein product [Effrenium voratum]|nr:unnamed protein product [Effrenium voratum]
MVSQFQGAAEISAMARQTHLRVLGLVFGLLFARYVPCFDLWESLFNEKDSWRDYRGLKQRGLRPDRFPDWRRKNGEGALWAHSAPEWATARLNGSDSGWEEAIAEEDAWKDLFANPDSWKDYREGKQNPRFPDFKRDDGQALWLDSWSTPDWVSSKLQDNDQVWTTETQNVPGGTGASTGTKPKDKEMEELWNHLFANGDSWKDYREGKQNPRFPDFKRDDGQALWLDSWSTPDWVSSKLQDNDQVWTTETQNVPGGTGASTGTKPKDKEMEELWKDLFANRDSWKDYREGKQNPRFPDFKRDDDQALWLDSWSTPDWVSSKLQDNDQVWTTETQNVPGGTGASTGTKPKDKEMEELWKDLFANRDSWKDYREGKQNPRFPDFKRDDVQALWLDSWSTPDWVSSKLQDNDQVWTTETQNVPGGTGASTGTKPKDKEMEELWKDLFANRDSWKDYREGKQNPRFPDFKRDDDQALWLDSWSTPDWVSSKLQDNGQVWTTETQNVPGETAGTSTRASTRSKPADKIQEELWNDLFADPDTWTDYRKGKQSPRFPDFKRDDGQSLWVDSWSTPDWVASELKEDMWAQGSRTEPASDQWSDLLKSPHLWVDHRHSKRSEKYPDFIKVDGTALWLGSSSTPDWVGEKLKDVAGFAQEGDGKATPKARATDPEEIDRLWKALLGPKENGWLDYRERKIQGADPPDHPDFLNANTQDGLWLADAPDWALKKLKQLDA